MIKVIQPGLFTTIQDGGRHGYRNIGIPTSGFMDQESAWAANKIVDNDREESLIEITLKGPTLLFNDNHTISITGGDFNPLINDIPIKMYESINVNLGDTLKINNTKIPRKTIEKVCLTLIISGLSCLFHLTEDKELHPVLLLNHYQL